MVYKFSYENPSNEVIDASVEMVIPDFVTVDEMLGFFERFLVASGYCLDSDERLEFVKKKKEEENSSDTLKFSKGDVWFKDGELFPSVFGERGWESSYTGSGVLGGLGEDHFSFAGGPVVIEGSAGKDIITFS